MIDLLAEIALPDLEDPLFKPFWEGMKVGELRLQYCPTSDTIYWPPRFRCSTSGSTEFEWITARPHGRIYSFVTVGKSMIKGFEAPYNIALVTLNDHPSVRLVGVIDGSLPPVIGADVKGHFVSAGEAGALPLLRWSLVA